jgi:hypothetical protein
MVTEPMTDKEIARVRETMGGYSTSDIASRELQRWAADAVRAIDALQAQVLIAKEALQIIENDPVIASAMAEQALRAMDGGKAAADWRKW